MTVVAPNPAGTDAYVYVMVRQAGQSAPSLTISPVLSQVPYTGGTVSVAVTTNQAEWQAKSVSDWLSVPAATAAAGQSLTVSVPANSSTNTRLGVIVMTAGSDTLGWAYAYVIVVQAGAPAPTVSLNLSHVTLLAGADGATITVSTNQTTWSVVGEPTWLTVAPSSGADGDSFTLEASANSGATRAGLVTVKAGTAYAYLLVTQPGQ
jgi:hypothetical protein